MVDSRLINAKIVNYNDRAPPPSRLPDVTHVTLSPRPSPPGSDQKLKAERPGNEATETPCLSSVLMYKLGMLEFCYVQNGVGLICTSLKCNT